MQFVDVIIPLHLPQTLTYSVPLEWQDQLAIGKRADVSLGKNKHYAAIIFRIHDLKPLGYDCKPISGIIDEHPVVGTRQLQFWEWIANYYLASLGDVMHAALPAHLKLMSENLLLWNDLADTIPQDLSDDAFMLAEALSIRKRLTLEEARNIVSGHTHHAINEILEQGLALVQDQLEEKYRPKYEKYVFLRETLDSDEAMNEVFEQLTRSAKQQKMLLAFYQIRQQDKEVPARKLLEVSGLSAAILNALTEKNILYTRMLPVDRVPQWGSDAHSSFSLSVAQQQAADEIRKSWQQQQQVLLHGVTGSGKTLVYIDLIRECIAEGKQALFLLPEIALTTQMIARLRSYFGEELGVYHSHFSPDERVEIWKKVQDNTYKIVLGARSAVWLPFSRLGLIIIDEEHDFSYKQQDPAPRFQARDSALVLAQLHDARVLLGSATPSVETLYNVQQKKYGYVSLATRYNDVRLPDISLVHARQTQPALSQFLTVPLLESIQQTLEKGQQVILFQNKRGYAPFLMCSMCGWIPHCKNCDVSMTYHKHSDKLHCHYCGTRSNPIQHCLNCGNNRIVSRNFGTEKAEEDLQRIFPQKKIARMDWDNMKGKGVQEKLLKDFEAGRIDILVGTQMVTKGLDFGNVGLVGILSADSLLNFPDFRTNERAYQLMEQVSGRAGRVYGDGLVVIQTNNLNHPLLSLLKAHNYKQFYTQEVMQRGQFGYPPYVRMIRIVCKHRDKDKVQKAAADLVARLQAIPHFETKGPTSGLIPRIQNMYIEEIWIKLPKQGRQLQELKFSIASCCNEVQRQRGNSSVQININVDPY